MSKNGREKRCIIEDEVSSLTLTWAWVSCISCISRLTLADKVSRKVATLGILSTESSQSWFLTLIDVMTSESISIISREAGTVETSHRVSTVSKNITGTVLALVFIWEFDFWLTDFMASSVFVVVVGSTVDCGAKNQVSRSSYQVIPREQENSRRHENTWRVRWIIRYEIRLRRLIFNSCSSRKKMMVCVYVWYVKREEELKLLRRWGQLSRRSSCRFSVSVKKLMFWEEMRMIRWWSRQASWERKEKEREGKIITVVLVYK